MIAEKDMLEQCVRVLEEIPAVRRVRVAQGAAGFPRGPGHAGYCADAVLDLTTREGREVRLLVEAKPAAALRHAMEHVHHLLAEAAKALDAHPVFFTDHAGPDLAGQLASRGMDFVDAAGNMRLAAAGLYIEISGRRIRSARPARGTLWTPAALKLVHLLLMRPDLASLPHRKLAELSGIAHGGVHALLGGLEQAGYLVRTDGRTRCLTNPQGLAGKWLDGYGQRLRRALLVGTYRTAGGLEELVLSLRRLNAEARGKPAVLGGELAAQRLAGELLRPASAAVYLPEGMEKREVLAQARLMPDPDGNVTLLRSFFPAELHLPDGLLADTGLAGIPCASALLIQGELTLLTDSRVVSLRESFARNILEPALHAADRH